MGFKEIALFCELTWRRDYKKLGIILENKVLNSKIWVKSKKCMYYQVINFNENYFQKDSNDF